MLSVDEGLQLDIDADSLQLVSASVDSQLPAVSASLHLESASYDEKLALTHQRQYLPPFRQLSHPLSRPLSKQLSRQLSGDFLVRGNRSPPILPHLASAGEPFSCFTMYKPKGVKVKPLAVQMPEKYTGERFFRPPLPRDPYETPLVLPAPPFVFGGRLTEDRVELIDFGPVDYLHEEEQQLLLSVLQLREKALAFDDSEKGCLSREYALDYEVPVVEHRPWNESTIPIPRPLYPKVIEMLRKEIEAGDLEPSSSPYATRWFNVAKKNGSLRKVLDASPMNAVTVRDTGVPPKMADFVQDFVGRQCYALFDLFRGYEQRWLAEKSRDMMTIRTPLGNLRATKIPQGACNSPAEFQRTIEHVLQPEIPDHLSPFLDDIGVKGPSSDYNGELVNGTNVRKFVWEHACNLERILFRLEHAGMTVSGAKLVMISPALEIVGSIVSKDGVRISKRALNKVSEWKTPFQDVKEVRAFLGTVNAIRNFFPHAASYDEPLRRLLMKNARFHWTHAQESAVRLLKEQVGHDRILVKLDYESGRPITLAVDSSHIAAGLAVYQDDEQGIRRPARFDSIAFSDMESRYSQPKLELCGVFKAVKRCKLLLYGVHFKLEVDAKSIVQMLNNPDVPSSPMSRWIAHLKLYDFEVVHVPARQHELVDGLSRGQFSEPAKSAELIESEREVRACTPDSVSVLHMQACVSSCGVGGGPSRVEPAASSELWCMAATPEPDNVQRIWMDASQVPYEWRDLVSYLQTGRMPADITYEDKRTLLRRIQKYYLRDGKLFRNSEDGLPQEVVLERERQIAIISDLHKTAHRGINAIYRLTSMRYWFEGMKALITEVLKGCDECQRRAASRERENLHPTSTSRIFQKVVVDCVNMSKGSGMYKYLVLARCDLSGWVEGRALEHIDSASVWTFFYEDVICRWGPILSYVVTDNGSEFEGVFDALMTDIGYPVVKSAAYNPQAHGMIERGHKPVFEALQKISKGASELWHTHLPAVLYADRVTTKRTTGYSPFELVTGAAPLLPHDATHETWVYTDWCQPMTTGELLWQRARQIQRMDADMAIAAARMKSARQASAGYMDEKLAYKTRKESLQPGSLVLQHDSSLRNAWTDKLRDRWYGPFIVLRQHEKGSYFLAELNGTPRQDSPVASHRLRQYYAPLYQRIKLPEPVRRALQRQPLSLPPLPTETEVRVGERQ